MDQIKQKFDTLYRIFLTHHGKFDQMDLGWFSNKTDESNRKAACNLAEIGMRSCLKLREYMNDAIN